ncbi:MULTISPECIES: Smr/MutS family protein [unclassified Mesorhizobium]|uniref:Smr/MutS family protein n=1 Tax=unclassified Mesorhizobium TaxID=325217 RepID=UPI0011267CA0|nr:MULTISPECIES: Smr/MutS family protein [unclassified Mesorhizobium]TPK90984.1 DNA mismatch repair protein MutS [Mesorhizobium sp. B2-4-16]TPL66086.1 DNA mismatch repair protein MutS [Mesorhizobium sp. B2-4-3]
MSRRDDQLSDDDRILWNLVARSARPLKGKTAVEIPDIIEPKPEPAAAPVNGVPVAAAKPKPQHVSHALDDQTLHKLKKGRLPIEGRVDLHGMTQDEAYSLLLTFLNRAHAGGIRYVLIITGKGSSSGGDGILRRAVPAWLSTPAFRHLVSSHDHAARNHGGSGALYVRLRRIRA